MPGSVVGVLSQWDTSALHWVVGHRWIPLNLPMALLSTAARGGGLWIVLGAFAAVVRSDRWRGFVQLLLAIGLAAGLADGILKPIVSRSRPFEAHADLSTFGVKPLSRSFPSGHAATAFAGGFALVRMVPAAGGWVWSLAVIVALSRIYLGMHYPLDVLAGAIIGLCAVVLCRRRNVVVDCGCAFPTSSERY